MNMFRSSYGSLHESKKFIVRSYTLPSVIVETTGGSIVEPTGVKKSMQMRLILLETGLKPHKIK